MQRGTGRGWNFHLKHSSQMSRLAWFEGREGLKMRVFVSAFRGNALDCLGFAF